MTRDLHPTSTSCIGAAMRIGLGWADTPQELLGLGLDGFVGAAATNAHASLLRAGLEAGVPTFCEKPVAGTLAESIELAKLAASVDVPVHVGFQRRFDAGYQRAAEVVRTGALGFLHTLRAVTGDEAPPHA